MINSFFDYPQNYYGKFKNESSLSSSHQTSSIENFLRADMACQRDIVILNAITGGQGDRTLAEKIKHIALEQNCRVAIIPFNFNFKGCLKANHKNIQDPLGLLSLSVAGKELYKPTVLIAPLRGLVAYKGWFDGSLIQLVHSEYKFPIREIIVVEEMNLVMDNFGITKYWIKNYAEKKDIPCKVLNLGFGEHEIGYLPDNSNDFKASEKRFKSELIKFADGYNLSLSDNNINWNVGYVSHIANKHLLECSVVFFISNALQETMHDKKDTNFFIIHSLDNTKMGQDEIQRSLFLEIKNFFNGSKDLPSTFSEMLFWFGDLKSKNFITHDLELLEQEHKINILKTEMKIYKKSETETETETIKNKIRQLENKKILMEYDKNGEIKAKKKYPAPEK